MYINVHEGYQLVTAELKDVTNLQFKTVGNGKIVYVGYVPGKVKMYDPIVITLNQTTGEVSYKHVETEPIIDDAQQWEPEDLQTVMDRIFNNKS
jgi:hypothetical protein